jgi:hypothetical protein
MLAQAKRSHGRGGAEVNAGIGGAWDYVGAMACMHARASRPREPSGAFSGSLSSRERVGVREDVEEGQENEK